MRRRDFITGIVGSAAAWPLAAHAQQPEQKRRLIGVLMRDYSRDLRLPKWSFWDHFAQQQFRIANVRFGSEADIEASSHDVRFTPESGHR